MAGITLIDKGHGHEMSGRLLDRLGQRQDLLAVLRVGWCAVQGQQMLQGIDRDGHLAALAPLAAVVASAGAALRGQCRVALSTSTMLDV